MVSKSLSPFHEAGPPPAEGKACSAQSKRAQIPALPLVSHATVRGGLTSVSLDSSFVKHVRILSESKNHVKPHEPRRALTGFPRLGTPRGRPGLGLRGGCVSRRREYGPVFPNPAAHLRPLRGPPFLLPTASCWGLSPAPAVSVPIPWGAGHSSVTQWPPGSLIGPAWSHDLSGSWRYSESH